MSSSKYSFVIDNMDWSYSRLSSFDDCKYKWFMKYVLGEEESDMFYASYGKFMHKILERFYNGEITKEQMLTGYTRSYSSEVRGDRPSAKIASSYFLKGLDYLRSFTPLPYKVLAVEEKMEAVIAGHSFVGFPDLVCEDNGEIIIIDNKSADLKPRSNRAKPTLNDKKINQMLTQLYIYAEFIKQKYGKYPKEFIFNCFRSGNLIREPFVYERFQEVMAWVESKISEIRVEEDYPPCVEYFPCNFLCGYHKDCVYFLSSSNGGA